MRSLVFVVPVAGRLPLASICLQQLRRTCQQIKEDGVWASAIVVLEKHEEKMLRNLIGSDLGFGVAYRDNRFVGRRFNDGIQLATDPRFNPHPADYVVPCGSDDWVDHRLFLEPLPRTDFVEDGVYYAGEIQGFQRMSFVREDAQEITSTLIGYRGGAGVRIIPRQLLEPLGYRPADEDRRRGCDTSILTSLSRHHGDLMNVRYFHLHDRQIVDWKTRGTQLNPYREVTSLYKIATDTDPFEVLAEFYPAEALEQMHAYYHARDRVAA